MTERKVSGDAPVKPEHDNNKKSQGMTAAKKTLAGTVMKNICRDDLREDRQ